MAGFLAYLEARYGRERVVNVFEGTGMESTSREHYIGGYVVRGVLPPEKLDPWRQYLEDPLSAIANSEGSRRVDLMAQK